ncbi:MAG: FAD-dependent oxidoreductase, partial [Pseudomonadota bacterium]
MQSVATKERLLIVGGGPTGVLSAIFASLAGYQVTLIEERESILMEPSILARMLHTSAAEFIESDSIDTKRDVLEGALFSKLVLPDPVFGNMPIRAGLSEAALAAGFASVADFDGHMDTMRVLYQEYFDMYEHKYPGRAASDLFGEPGCFISEVDIGQAQRLGWARNVARLYQGSDKTLNTPQFAAWALAQLRRRGVSVKTSCSVESIEAKETESGRVFIAAISPSLNQRDLQVTLEFEQVLVATAR